jgi:sugar/nucleoside kinase (ribokinase family)
MAVRKSMNPRWDVALFGDSFVDHVLSGFPRWPQPGEEAYAQEYFREAGGGAVNTACGLARLGRKAALFSIAGRDHGEWLIHRIQDFRVDTSEVLHGDLPTGLTVALSVPAERTFFTYRGVNAKLDAMLRDPSIGEHLAQSRHVHFACAPEREPAIATFEKLRAAGCTVSLDSGWHEDWLRDPSNLEVIGRTSVFFPNEREAQAITGAREPAHMLDFFVRHGASCVVIKLGKMGAVMIQNGVKYECAGIDVEAVDTTGAGDAFNSGFIHALLDHELPQRCLEIACVCGALSTRAAGALQALPPREEKEARSWAK